MTRQRLGRILAGLTVLAALARLAAWRWSPVIHPDEIYQALEPGWWRLEGTGLVTWEWREGIRSWVLPAYNGAWMAALRGLGVRQGAVLGWFVQLHWALVSLLLLLAAYRGGACLTRRLQARTGGAGGEVPGWQGGLLATTSCALFPLVVAFAPHTLSELPSMLCLVLGLVLTAELIWDDPGHDGGRRKALVIGTLLALGLCIRVVNAPLVLVPPLWLLARRRFSAVGWLALGAVGPVLLFGLVDLVTWGRFLGSYVRYIQFNFLRGGAAQFGVEPWNWYLQRLFDRAPLGLGLVLLPLLLGWRATWPFALSAFGLVASLSTQLHKEERFIIAFWPLVLIGAGGVLGAWLARLPGGRWRRPAAAGVILAALLPLCDGVFHLEKKDYAFSNVWLEGLARAGADPNATGLMTESILFCGGSVFWGRRLALFHVEPEMLDNTMVSHVLVRAGSDHQRQALRAGFVEVFSRDDAVLLRRP